MDRTREAEVGYVGSGWFEIVGLSSGLFGSFESGSCEGSGVGIAGAWLNSSGAGDGCAIVAFIAQPRELERARRPIERKGAISEKEEPRRTICRHEQLT